MRTSHTLVDMIPDSAGQRSHTRARLLGARLWIDGVGTWRIWLGHRLTIGGPGPSDPHRKGADLALLADLKRLHAEVIRCGEHYRLSLAGAGSINAEPVAGDAFLRSGDMIQLGEDVRLFFRIPSPLSASAVVEFASSHRPGERIDGLVLFEQTCLLGASSDHHILCPESECPVVLFLRAGRFWCRSRKPWHLNGHPCQEAAPVHDGALIATESLSFRIEYNES